MGLSATALKRLEARRKGADLAATDGGLFQGRAGTLNLKSMQKNVAIKDRKGATHGPEVHLIGEIVGGSGFGPGVCCKWRVAFNDRQWKLMGGHTSGQTQVDYPSGQDDMAVWAHPLDVHWQCDTVSGWPKLLMQVWKLDEHGRNDLAGYGFAHVPTAPGSYELEVSTWRPMGSMREEIGTHFIGSTPQLRDDDLLFEKAWSERCRLTTTTSGTIHLHMDVVLRYFKENNVSWG